VLSTLRKRLGHDDERGFTLIELMVVVLIIAILIAIAIPTFLGARERSQNRAAQSSLRNGLTAAKTKFTDDNNYSGATDTALDLIEPSLDFVPAATASTKSKEVSVSAATSVWKAAVLADTGKCFSIYDDSSSGGGGTKFGEIPSGTACSGASVTTGATGNTNADKFPS
jgi:type IV pilus assembly protein PilA